MRCAVQGSGLLRSAEHAQHDSLQCHRNIIEKAEIPRSKRGIQSVDKVLFCKIRILKKKNMLWINGGRKTLVFLPPSPHL